ncbi:hypothetical protein [Chitinophaga solisilvae]|uniref:hypothetical protein n=1 Tax=Chitinophaga solisilvae TaxID=1233460 RepID=UPI00136FDCF5|nr:hypothetical protein [Chitinophaga solisilvae]
MKRLCSFLVCLLIAGTARNAAAQGPRTDTVLTTKGAVTLITCGSPISTFQIGDGKNADYDYRIVDGSMVFVRPIVANPRPTNLIVREGDNIHYMILAFRDKADLAKLKYALSKKSRDAVASNAGGGGTLTPTRPGSGDSGGRQLLELPAEDEGTLISIDTVTVSKIADDFGRDRKVNHQHEVKVDGINLGYAQAMTLNNMHYFCFRVRNKNKEPYEIVKATLLHKEKKDSSVLHSMPLLYKKGPAVIAGKEDATEVFVVPSKQFRKDDEVLLVLQSGEDKPQVVLYVPVSALPKYMVTK